VDGLLNRYSGQSEHLFRTFLKQQKSVGKYKEKKFSNKKCT